MKELLSYMLVALLTCIGAMAADYRVHVNAAMAADETKGCY